MPRLNPSSPALPAATPAPTDRLGPAWRTWLLGSAALLLMCAWTLGPNPGVEAIRALIRATARSSLMFFLLAYTASSWRTWRPGPVADWLRQRRRQWGLLFATSHSLHAVGIALLHATASPALWSQLTPLPSWVLGGAGYLLITLLAVSSNDAAIRLLGPARWTRLHRVGVHGLWLLFVLSCAKRVGGDLFYLLPLGLLIAAMALRLQGRLLKRRGSSL